MGWPLGSIKGGSGEPAASIISARPGLARRDVPVCQAIRVRQSNGHCRRSPHDLKKLSAASFEARFLVTAACSRSTSVVSSAMRSVNSSTDKSDRS